MFDYFDAHDLMVLYFNLYHSKEQLVLTYADILAIFHCTQVNCADLQRLRAQYNSDNSNTDTNRNSSR